MARCYNNNSNSWRNRGIRLPNQQRNSRVERLYNNHSKRVVSFTINLNQPTNIMKKEIIIISIITAIACSISALLIYTPYLFAVAFAIFVASMVRNKKLERQFTWDVYQSIWIFATAIVVFFIFGLLLVKPLFGEIL